MRTSCTQYAGAHCVFLFIFLSNLESRRGSEYTWPLMVEVLVRLVAEVVMLCEYFAVFLSRAEAAGYIDAVLYYRVLIDEVTA